MSLHENSCAGAHVHLVFCRDAERPIARRCLEIVNLGPEVAPHVCDWVAEYEQSGNESDHVRVRDNWSAS